MKHAKKSSFCLHNVSSNLHCPFKITSNVHTEMDLYRKNSITMPTSTCYIIITRATPSSVSTLVKTKSWIGRMSVALVSTDPA